MTKSKYVNKRLCGKYNQGNIHSCEFLVRPELHSCRSKSKEKIVKIKMKEEIVFWLLSENSLKRSSVDLKWWKWEKDEHLERMLTVMDLFNIIIDVHGFIIIDKSFLQWDSRRHQRKNIYSKFNRLMLFFFSIRSSRPHFEPVHCSRAYSFRIHSSIENYFVNWFPE